MFDRLLERAAISLGMDSGYCGIETSLILICVDESPDEVYQSARVVSVIGDLTEIRKQQSTSLERTPISGVESIRLRTYKYEPRRRIHQWLRYLHEGCGQLSKLEQSKHQPQNGWTERE